MLRRRRKETWDGTDRRAAPLVRVVNTDSDACELLVRILGAAGYRASGHATDRGTMAGIMNDTPRCIVLDSTEPVLGASFTLLDQIRTCPDRRVRTARVVVCAPSGRIRDYAFESGADAFLARPFHADELVDEVRKAIDTPRTNGAGSSLDVVGPPR